MTLSNDGKIHAIAIRLMHPLPQEVKLILQRFLAR